MDMENDTNDAVPEVNVKNNISEIREFETGVLKTKEDECAQGANDNISSRLSVCANAGDCESLQPITMEDLDMSWSKAAHNNSNYESGASSEDTVYFCPSNSDPDIDDSLDLEELSWSLPCSEEPEPTTSNDMNYSVRGQVQADGSSSEDEEGQLSTLSIFEFEIQEIEVAAGRAGEETGHESVSTRLMSSGLSEIFPCIENALQSFGKADDTLLTVVKDLICMNIESGGWIAVWSPGSDLKPCIDGNVLVEIVHVDPEEMVAHCRPTSITDEDEGTAPETVEICLSELYVAEEQRNVFDLEKTTNAVEFFRMIKFIFRPWEMELEMLEVFPDIFQKRINMILTEYSSLPLDFKTELQELRIESNHTYSKLRKELIKMDEESFESESERDTTKIKIVELQFKLEDLEFKFNRVENPLWREMIITRKGADPKKEIELIDESYIIVAPGLKISTENVKLVLDFIQKGSNELRFTDSLAEAVMRCRVGVTIFLFGGRHPIGNLGALAKGGRIICLSESKAVISSNRMDDNWLVVDCEEDGGVGVHLENVTIEAEQKVMDDCGMQCPQACILAISGRLDLTNVSILGTRCEPTASEAVRTIGVWMLSGANLTATNLVIQSFTSGVVLGLGSSCHLTDAGFLSCEIEIEGADNADLTICSSTTHEKQPGSPMSQ